MDVKFFLPVAKVKCVSRETQLLSFFPCLVFQGVLRLVNLRKELGF